MPFDQTTRNRLARFVGDARDLLTAEFTRQLQQDYGIDPAGGEVSDLKSLTGKSDAQYQTAQLIRETAQHYLPGFAGRPARERRDVLDRIVREQAFTVLNRLAALRMAESRGLLLESLAGGYQSRGFQLYSRLAGAALGETGAAYRSYLFSLFDELAVDLPVLFERFAPEARLFPGETALLQLLSLINHPEIANLWAEDETIGWVYQYFNSQEERKAMRAESAAPRNSRELAVRNQFFTPRYVVEFLADNTLGRTWYEMTKGESGLVDSCRYLVRRPNEVFLAPGEQPPAHVEPVEGLSQEEMLRQPVSIPHRPLKDPRGILMLDPACGSMHFGLYAFDLFERIYEEAWEIEAERGPKALARVPMDAPLHEVYASKEVFLRDVPRLIVERNIHGVDIDPRAVQIAGLSLWLRAQRGWREQGVKAQDRPAITRSNIVCAEPMPGDPALLKEFIARQLTATPEDQVIGEMLPPIFRAMALAGEAGSLLKIEQEIAGVVELARARYEQALLKRRKEADYLPGLAPERDTTIFDLLDLPQPEEFWLRAEERIYAALRAYAEDAEGGAGYRRRLFADDAAQGFAFIDLCRRRYDVVLMNPPFGDASRNTKTYIDENFPLSAGNLLANFIERALAILLSTGLLGAIVSRSCFYLQSFSSFRNGILKEGCELRCFADLGENVLDAMVEVAALVCEKKPCLSSPSVFLRHILPGNKEQEILVDIDKLKRGARGDAIFTIYTNLFDLLPGAPYVYWISRHIAELLSKYPTVDPSACNIRVGLQTGDDFRFLRLWSEVSSVEIAFYAANQLPNSSKESKGNLKEGGDWKWYSKIDEASPFIAPIHLVVNWRDNGSEIRGYHEANGDSPSRYVRSEDYYLMPGISYMLRSHRIIPYVVPSGVIPTAGRSQIYPISDMQDWLLLLFSSNFASAIARFRGENFARPKFQNTMVGAVPFVAPPQELIDRGLLSIKSSVAHYSQVFQADEGAIQFLFPESRIEVYSSKKSLSRSSLIDNITELAIAKVFGLSESDFQELQRDLMESVSLAKTDVVVGNAQTRPHNFISDQLSYFIGSVLGRWDIRYATGERPAPELPDPFAALPVCPPGMLQNDKGLPAAPEDVPDSYPLRITWPGILVDDAGHAEDIAGRVREAIQVIWGERAEAIEQEACEILGVKSLRDYLRRPASFFADHLSRYSKSRRQAPIYWPLSTHSGSYTLWLYYHRLTDQSLYSCVNDFVDPKLRQVGEELERLRRKAGRSGREEKELEQLSELSGELTDLRAELLRVAAFWKPNLNDGVQITAAPLWRLFQHKPWQKRLKETWESLERGDYDWAHLAYSVWPARVREKCKTDKSLAIAHELEELYVEGPITSKKSRGKAK